ncbi:MFS transporter [Niveibacterium sp. SC-1]|uniref:MFS transporter n=1 Tax=Niveibacterium sp. SC-1 TaxID=3135646 RepID=UPI00311DA00B
MSQGDKALQGAAKAAPVSFAALRIPGYRVHFATYILAMMGDNIEHVISYWMAYQKFHSAALGGFAVLSHWLPFLLFAVPAGALADRFDPRRLIQCGMALFILASLGWAWFFITDTLQLWHAMTLLVIHGFAGVLWQTSSQLLVHDIVPPQVLTSAVRLNATARTLGVLVGPAVGGAIMLTLGPRYGLILNACFYLPLVLWLWKAPYGPRFRKEGHVSARAVRGFRDILQTARDITSQPLLLSMILLAGAASFFIGNSYQAQMPNFAQDLGHGDPGVSYSMLLAADAAGALTAGVLLERWGLLKPDPRTAVLLAMGWCLALGCFALSHHYALSLALLFTAGLFELSFSSMTQALVQLNAPAAIRGRVIGLFNMAAMGMRAFSGITVGLMGTIAGVHWSLATSAAVMFVVLAFLRRRVAPA